MNFVLFSNDFFFASQLEAAARRAGLAFHQVSDPSQVDKAVGLCQDAVVLLDLSAPMLHRDFGLIATLRATPAPPRTVCAFGQHVLETLLQRARAAGCDQVLSRGQLSRQGASFFECFKA